jgi:hypothetical protein
MTIELNVNTTNLPTFPSYNYGAFIKGPNDLSMTTDVTGWGIDTISSNMAGLIDYIDGILISGTSSASKAVGLMHPDISGQPLGNAYFYDSGMTCKNTDGQDVSALMYMNNISTGNIPLISSMGGGDIKELRGLIPGIFEDLEGFDPRELMYALTLNKKDPCLKVSLPITNIAEGGNKYSDGLKTQYVQGNMFKQYVSLIDPCLFNEDTSIGQKEGVNPADKTNTCIENFSNIYQAPNIANPQNTLNTSIETSDDIFIQIYFISVAILFLFILLKLLHK